MWAQIPPTLPGLLPWGLLRVLGSLLVHTWSPTLGSTPEHREQHVSAPRVAGQREPRGQRTEPPPLPIRSCPSRPSSSRAPAGAPKLLRLQVLKNLLSSPSLNSPIHHRPNGTRRGAFYGRHSESEFQNILPHYANYWRDVRPCLFGDYFLTAVSNLISQ